MPNYDRSKVFGNKKGEKHTHKKKCLKKLTLDHRMEVCWRLLAGSKSASAEAPAAAGGILKTQNKRSE